MNGTMAQSERRSLLSSLDANTPLGLGTTMTAGPPSKLLNKGIGSSRQSMIPRQSILPNRVPSGNGQDVASNAISRYAAAPRSSMAVGMGANLGVGSSTGMDMDVAGPSTLSTPHRITSGASRRQDNVARMSFAMTPSNRKSISTRQSYAPRGGPTHKGIQQTDPRSIREDKHLLTRMENDIQQFLQDTGFVFPAKYSGDFHMPSQALVMSAFRHIYHHCIDSKQGFVNDTKKDAEEVIQLLSDIRYLVLLDVSKTKLGAPGSIHNWPPICGMLHWMIFTFSSFAIPTSKFHSGPLDRPLSIEDDDFCHYFPYLWLCFEQWWQGKDEFPLLLEELKLIFVEKERPASEEIQMMQEEQLELKARLKELIKLELPLKFEEGENEVLKRDVKKFQEYIYAVLTPRIEQYNIASEKHLRDSTNYEEEIQTLGHARTQLQRQVEAQQVSDNDFETMSRDREQLAESMRLMMSKLQDHHSNNSHLEIYLSNQQSRAEDELKKLSDQCRELGSLPFTLSNGAIIHDLDIVAGNSETMLPKGLDLKRDFKRLIVERRDAFSKGNRVAGNEKISDQEQYDVILENIEERRDEVSKIETNLRSIKEQLELSLAASKEDFRSQDEGNANANLAIAQLEQSGRSMLDQAESKLNAAQMQINLVRDEDVKMRNELHQKFVAGLEVILSLKSLVAEGFKALEEAAIDQSRQE